MKILVVEDEQHIAEGLRFNIEAEGHVAIVVHDGEDALRKLGTAKYDAVVLDVMLPGINGFEVAKAMRALPPKAVQSGYIPRPARRAFAARRMDAATGRVVENIAHRHGERKGDRL
jgi:CheY-like chemotaxis protein